MNGFKDINTWNVEHPQGKVRLGKNLHEKLFSYYLLSIQHLQNNIFKCNIICSIN